MTDIITAFMNGLITYDYILFGSVFFLFLIFIILGIILRKKAALAVFLILLAFVILTLGSTLGYIKMHQYLFKNSTSITSYKELTFTKAVVIYGVVKNTSNFDFKSCNITASAYPVSGNSIKDYILKFKPFNKMSILEYDILRGEEREFKLILDPFTYSKDYNISLGANCK